jgi:hypothetical protein
MTSEQALLMVMDAYHHILWSGIEDWDNYVHLHTLNDLLRVRGEILAEQIPLRLRSFRPTLTEVLR